MVLLEEPIEHKHEKGMHARARTDNEATNVLRRLNQACKDVPISYQTS